MTASHPSMKKQLKARLRPLIRPYQRSMRRLGKHTLRWMLYPLRALPVSSESFGPPKGYYHTLADWQAKEGQGTIQKVHEAHRLKRHEPGTLESKVHWKITQEYRHDAPNAFVATVPHGRLWVHHNFTAHVDAMTIISAGDKVIGQISHEFGPPLPQHTIFEQRRLPKAHVIPGKVAVLTSVKGEQFFHWMLDLLPKIDMLQRAGHQLESFDAFVVNSCQSRFMRDTLEMVGIPPEKVVTNQDFSHLKADELVVPTPPHVSGNPQAWAMDFLRDIFLPTPGSLPADLPRKLYISRAKAEVRNVVNEEEVRQYLEGRGFETIMMEELPIQQQIALFARAEVIVAPHGAGLTHLVFARQGIKVIELFSPLYVNACFYSLANLMHLDYHYFVGRGRKPLEGRDLEINVSDITADLAQLQAILAQAGVS